MNHPDGFRLALQLGCPVLAVRWLLEHDGPVALHHLTLLRRGRQRLYLPSGCPDLPRLTSETGIQPEPVEQPKGVYCLATHDWPGDHSGRVGSLRLLRAERARPPQWDDFAAGCDAGEQAAASWLVERFGLIDLQGRRYYRPSPLPPLVLSGRERQAGESAGLAATIEAVRARLGTLDVPGERVAATGVVRWGKVYAVQDVAAKLAALIREAPAVRVVYIPAANASEIPQALEQQLEIRTAERVEDVLQQLFGTADDSMLATVDPARAARLAVELEAQKRHETAAALARAVMDARERWPREQVDALAIEARARGVLAINLCHQSRPDEAEQELDQIESMVRAAPEPARRGALDADLKALLAAKAASVYIDRFDAARALRACERLDPLTPGLSHQPRIELLGSWTRALAFTGDLERALDMSKRQLEHDLPLEHRHQYPQCCCNQLDILVRMSVREPQRTELIAEMDAVLARAREVNDRLAAREASLENARYLDLWESRRCALCGDVQRARELAGPRDPGVTPAWPGHYLQRFVGEALARAGRIDEAIEQLEWTDDAVSDDVGLPLRLVLKSAGAVAAVLRIEHGQGDWQHRATGFLTLLQEHAPSFVEPLSGDAPPDKWAACLRDVLQRLPY